MNRKTALAVFAALEPVESALVCARACALELDRDLDLVGALDLARARGLDHDLAIDHALGDAHKLLTDLDRNLDIDLLTDPDRDFNFARVLARARDLALDRDRDRMRARARALVRDLDIALELLRGPDQHPAAAAGDQLMPGRVSRGLLALAVRLLPAAQRSRYDAEFRSELGELRRRERWGYAVRVLVGAWELRRALVELVRTLDGDVARRAER